MKASYLNLQQKLKPLKPAYLSQLLICTTLLPFLLVPEHLLRVNASVPEPSPLEIIIQAGVHPTALLDVTAYIGA